MQLDAGTELHGALTTLPLGAPQPRERGAECPHDARRRQTDWPDDLHHEEAGRRRGRSAGEAYRRQDDPDDEEGNGQHEHAAAGRLQRRPALRHLRQHRRADATLAVDRRDGRPRRIGELSGGRRRRTKRVAFGVDRVDRQRQLPVSRRSGVDGRRLNYTSGRR